jgi:hypothetical protein
MKKIHTLLLLCLLAALPAYAQEISGYVSDMPSLITLSPGGVTWWQNQLHSRFNLGWQPAKLWRADAGIRTRLLTGSRAMVSAGGAEADGGWADLSWHWARGSRLSGHTAVDRLNVTFEQGKWKLQLGRQRINWGQTFVWNPNDLFNTYSFFDFDYPERPGSDALRVTWFHSETASLEAAASVNGDGRVTTAAQYRWNRHSVDYQLIVGEQAETDLVVGGAWTGDFNGLNFRGEFTCYRPFVRRAETGNVVALSVGVDYIFSNSLMLQAEALYNNAGNAVSVDGLTGLYSAPLSSKRLSVCDWSLFAQAACPVTSRLNVSLSGIYFADIKSFYAGFTADCSLAENLDLSVIGQLFSSPDASPSAADGLRSGLSFVRLKYSF